MKIQLITPVRQTSVLSTEDKILLAEIFKTKVQNVTNISKTLPYIV